ncbi:MAG: aminotransferase class I/II-fold pyridoxal phosphate-dependent enzyme [Candidatus Nanopelagicales bacterium]|jgi:cystathionine beta-lyase|nr:aminotransferase class I/II-fold pyridoxal phosphate-dependent enzyme [Candidatus Nanopelagicales bacterium]
MPIPPFEVLSESQLRARASLKWQHFGPEVLPLWVAEMDVLPAPEVVEALTAAVRAGDLGYPRSTREYAEAFAAFAEQRWQWAPNPADAHLCADVMTGVRALVEVLVPPGGPVLVPSPVYPPFALFPREVGRLVVPVPLTAAGRLDAAAIEATLTEQAAAGTAAPVVLLCSPHNPTGVVHTADELRAVAVAADRAGAHVVVDEVHAPLVPEGAAFTPWHTVADAGFVVTSAAKAFNLAGLKAALVLASPASRPHARRLPEWVKYGASHLGVIGHAAALRADPAWLDAVNANIAGNRALLAGLLDQRLPGVGYRPPEATYLAWLDCRALGLGDDPAEHFLKVGRVALMQGPPFGPGGAGHVRLNLACSAAVLSGAVERMAAAVAGHLGR